jgi:serine/threonine protein kinase
MEPGEILAQRYRIERKLGEGGMGVVYEAEHLITGRRYAVKVLEQRASLAKEDVDRFLREAQAPAKIRHPNIVDVTDAGTEPDGTPFIVMELLEGEGFDQVLKRDGVVQPGPLATIMGQLLDGLDAMHARGFVHRDLKPANIFLLGESSLGVRVKVLDFGIAKALGEESRTQSGYVIGTPAYMAPEQMRNARNATPRSDLWSVGIILYESLVGHRPFRGETFGLLAMITGPDKHIPLSSVAPQVPRALSDLVDSLLAKDATKRPQSAAAVKQLLLPLLAKCPPLRAIAAADAPVPPSNNERADVAQAPTENGHRVPTEDLTADDVPLGSDAIPLERGAHENSPRRTYIALAGALAVAAIGTGLWMRHRDEQTRRTQRPVPHAPSEERTVGQNHELGDFLHRWLGTVTASQGQASVVAYYADATKFRSSPGLATPAAIRTYWSALFAGGGSFVIDWDRSTYAEEPANLGSGASAACVNLPGAIGPVLRVRAWATEQMRDRSVDIGCERLEGVYLVRVRRAAGELRICHETWSLREGVCASCPTAPACQNGGSAHGGT